MRTLVLKAFALIRKVYSRLFWQIAKLSLAKPKENLWHKYRFFKLEEFNTVMKGYPYAWDPFKGAFDYTLLDESYFFDRGNEANRLYGRDCDDFAFVWKSYLNFRPRFTDVTMVICADGLTFKSSHVFTAAKSKAGGKWFLFNYTQYGKPFETLEDLCQEFSRVPLVSSGVYSDLIWCKY
jgi:hypothetical protein